MPNLTTFEMGGITLIVAVYLVLQVLKRKYQKLGRYIPVLTIALAALLVGSAMFLPVLFNFLAATILTAALIFTAHAVMKNNGAKPPDKSA